MYCSKCGQKIQEDAKFCLKCGKKIIVQKEILQEEIEELPQEETSCDNVVSFTRNIENTYQNNDTVEKDEHINWKGMAANFLYGSFLFLFLFGTTISFYDNYKYSGSVNSALSDTFFQLSHLGDRSTYNLELKSTVIPAWKQAQELIRNDLTSPSSAKFPPIKDVKFTVEKSKNNYIIFDSYVDCKNAFGTMVREHFIVKIYKINNSWHLEYLE